MRTDVLACDPRSEPYEICGAVRSRLNYRLCCRLPANHGGEHRWTPEIPPAGTRHRAVPVLRHGTTGHAPPRDG